MEPITILKDVVTTVRNAVWNTFPDNLKYTVYPPVTRKLRALFPDAVKEINSKQPDLNLRWEGRIKTMLNGFGGSRKKMGESEPYHTFILLCTYLGIHIPFKTEYGKRQKYTYHVSPDQVIRQLERKGILTHELAERQLTDLARSDRGESPGYYTCYLSAGKNAPVAARLELFFKKKQAALLLPGDPEERSIGDIKLIGSHLFIQLSNQDNGFLSFFYLHSSNGQPEFANTFTGSYSAAPTDDSGLTACKVIVRKNDGGPEQASPLARYELFDETIGLRKTTAFHAVKEVAGTYQGYWFVVSRQFHIVRMVMVIGADGSCRIKGLKNEDMYGYVTGIDMSRQVLKCALAFHPDDEPAALHLVFDLKSRADGYLDGAYSGHQADFHLVAGKIRLYCLPIEQPAEPPVKVSLDDAERLLPGIGRELLDFFVGNPPDAPSSRFLQPNYSTFRKWFDPLVIESTGDSKRFNKTYLMLRLDTDKEQVNRYMVRIQDGTASFSLQVAKGERKYLGTATFLSPCLMLNIYKRDQIDYDALYIFYVFGRPTGVVNYFNGVYATTTYSDAPICGRVILLEADNNTEYSPIPLYSNEYFRFNSAHDRALDLLTGVENNMIKVNKHENNLGRNISYGPLFFHYACVVPGDENKSRYLKFALDHGFNDVTALDDALKNRLEVLVGNVKISIASQDESITEIILKYKDKRGQHRQASYRVMR